jgi:hypothetical protein
MILGVGMGVWSVTVQGDLNLKFYTYRVTNSNGVSEIVIHTQKASGQWSTRPSYKFRKL